MWELDHKDGCESESENCSVLSNSLWPHGLYSPTLQARILEWVSFSAEHQRIDAFKLWCWRRLLRVPWTARRLNQSILREINPEYSLEGLLLKLKLQYFGHLIGTPHWKSPSCWEILRAEGEVGIGGWHGWTASSMQWTRTWANFRRRWGTERPGML